MAEPGHRDGHRHRHADDPARLAIEAQLASGLVDEAIALCATQLAGRVERIVDLGCGPGVHAMQLAQRFPAATVTAADGSPAMLEQVAERAARLGLDDRVETSLVDLDGELVDPAGWDLAFASMAVHHARDQVATLGRIRALLRPGGLLCLLERADPLVVRLADDDPGRWERLELAQREAHERARHRLPGALDADRYPDMLGAAGLDVLTWRTLVDTVQAPDDAATQAFIADHVRRVGRSLAGIADAHDLAVLAARADWRGAAVTSSRRLLVARPAER